MIFFWGSNPKAVSEHRHPAIQLVLATQNSFSSKNENGEWVEKEGLLIAPNYFHECNAQNIHILTINIDPESILGEWVITHYLNEKKIIDFPSTSIEFEKISHKLENQQWEDIRVIIEDIFLFQKAYKPSQKDERIEKVLNFISKNIDNSITTKHLTEVALLSESRLLHLFKEKMGLPIRNYILWIRLKIVITQILEGQSLTKAAFEAGFSDQAHMTRTFIKMIGIAPSTFSKNSKFIQVSFP